MTPLSRLLGVVFCASVAACAPGSHLDEAVHILAPEHGPGLTGQCSRSAPRPQSYWAADRSTVGEAERRLTTISGMEREQIGDPLDTLRQYVGVVVDGHRYLYLNALPKSESAHIRKSLDQPIMVCDGGPHFWGALYDPDKAVFLDVEGNGSL